MKRHTWMWMSCVLALGSSAALAQNSDPLAGPGSVTDSSSHARPQEVSAMVFVPWVDQVGIGVSLRYTYPLLPEGFIPNVNDSFELEGGADLFGQFPSGAKVLGVNIPTLDARYSFHLTPQASVFALAGFALAIRHVSVDTNSGSVSDTRVAIIFDSGIGGEYRFTSALAARVDVTYSGLRAGISYLF